MFVTAMRLLQKILLNGCALRLIELLSRPEDIQFLAPMFTKGILYILLKDQSFYFQNKLLVCIINVTCP
ncbi:AraC family transcriptional regulator N-terminal domain-containing protein [Paenibacillus sp. 19GGS1-52]|nr:AraC family transcriptional regulator N-terminal domain-containing protein [Paenibacillus sp. 19GGS1-52]